MDLDLSHGVMSIVIGSAGTTRGPWCWDVGGFLLGVRDLITGLRCALYLPRGGILLWIRHECLSIKASVVALCTAQYPTL